MRHRNADLVVVAVLAVASVFAIVFGQSRPVRILFALPLLFLLPGSALTAVLFPRGELDRARRLLLQLGLSVAVAILGALLLDLTFGLRRWSWAVLLAVVTCAGAAIAARRRTAFARTVGRMRLPRLVEAALLGVALAVVAGAVLYARTPLAARHIQGYTALSMTPAGGSADGRIVRVEISSGELRTVTYRLVLYVGSRRFRVRRVTLAPGDRWQRTLRIPTKPARGSTWIRVRLYRKGNPYGAYRSVRIRLP